MSNAVLYGDWSKAKQWFSSVRQSPLTEEVKKAADSLGQAITERIQFHIHEQDLPWPPVSTQTTKRSGKILLESGAYVKSISHEVSTAGKFELTVFVSPKGTHPKSGVAMDLLGSYFEYGTSKMPARPLWRPVVNEIPTFPEWKAFLAKIRSLGFGD